MKNILTKKEQETLEIMGFKSLEEVLEYYPFRYEIVNRTLYKDWIKDEKVCFEGKIISSFKVARFGKRNSVRFDCLVEDNYVIHCTIFNRIWISKIDISKSITFFGKYDGFDKVTLSNYNSIELDKQKGIQPVYSLKEEVNLKYFTNIVRKALDNCHTSCLIPGSLMQKYRLYPKDEAIKQIHFPENKQLLDLAKRTLKYEEFLKFETLVLLKRRDNVQLNEQYSKSFNVDDVYRLASTNLDFDLTIDQVKAINDILADLKDPKSMYRLVQGDVGCGKTIVATLALYANYLANYQGAFMVPTELLATQQYEELKKVFKGTEVKVACLYSSLSVSDKKEVLNGLNNGNIDIVVGTHALIQDNVNFKKLGLVVTDEQHRFGVKQRAKLNEKGQYVDILVMSATPIPRTLASIFYGDTDVSNIKTLPANRKPVITKIIDKNSIIPFYDDLTKMLDCGSKVYIVCPMIDENDKLRNVNDITNALNTEFKDKYKISSLNGKMTPIEKSEVMDDFKNGDTQILVSTTVIEVGVNVKEANIMIIYDADRFGLSQLHQLRGRVKRGSKQGYCYLLTNNYKDEAKERLDALANNENGFDIADLDLKFRGFGDLFGERQSGLPNFKIGNIETDANIVRCAIEDVKEIISDPKEEDYILINYAKDYLNNLDEID